MLNTNTVSIDELRSNLADIVNRVTYAKEKVVVKKHNRDVAVLISLDEYEKVMDPAKRLTEIQWQNSFKSLDKIRAKMPKIDPEKLEQEIAEAIQEVREEKRAKNK